MKSNIFSSLLFILLYLTVAQSARALSVKITSPKNGTRFESCANITIKAEADISDDDIKRFYFYRDGRSIRSIRTAPWEYIMENMPDGIYDIYVKVTDVNDESAVSDPVQIFVGSVADGEKLKNGEFACGLSPWHLVLNEASGAAATFEIEPEGWLSGEPSMAMIDILNPGTENWHVMIVQPCPIDSGHFYDVYFVAEVEDNKTIGVDFQSTTGDYPVYFWHGVDVTFDTYEYGPIEYYCDVTDPSNEFKLALSQDNKGIFIDAIQVIDRNWEKNTSKVQEKPAITGGFLLVQNYPNPFNPSTEIKFECGQTGFVSLSIYNIQGQLVKTLVNEAKSAGEYVVFWDGMDQQGLPAPSGIYLYRMKTENFEMSRQMLLIR